MSWLVRIHRAKPNPAGKDSNPVYESIPGQILAEWVDLKNVGDQSVSLSVLHLANTQFSDQCVPKKEPVIYWSGSNGQSLGPNQTVRIHTGRSSERFRMHPDDAAGVDFHAFAERGSFVLNNRCGDALSVWWKSQDGQWQREDGASYAPNAPDGAVLRRVENMLVP